MPLVPRVYAVCATQHILHKYATLSHMHTRVFACAKWVCTRILWSIDRGEGVVSVMGVAEW